MQRAKFAGAEAGIGIVVFTLFYVFGVLAVVGVGALLVTKQMHADAGTWVIYVAGAALVSWWGAMIARELRGVRVVEIADDGTWILRGPLGMKRGTIAPGEARAVHDRQAERWILAGVPRRFTMSWADIEAGARRWTTCGGTPKSQRAAIDLLQRWVASH
jgi:hypothetical protein